MQELLTLKEIARQLGVPESNLRYYKNKIGDFLPSVGKGRRRRYLPESIDVFKRTVELVNEGMTLDRVYKHLSQEQPPELDSVSSTSRDEFAKQIAEKIAASLGHSTTAAGSTGEAHSTDTLNQQLGLIRDELASARASIEEKEIRNRELASRLEELIREKDRLESEADGLRAESTSKAAEISALKEQLAEKDKIVRMQRQQLLDARNQRLKVAEELGVIRAILEEMKRG